MPWHGTHHPKPGMQIVAVLKTSLFSPLYMNREQFQEWLETIWRQRRKGKRV